jgi:hypothetical protein
LLAIGDAQTVDQDVLSGEMEERGYPGTQGEFADDNFQAHAIILCGHRLSQFDFIDTAEFHSNDWFTRFR